MSRKWWATIITVAVVIGLFATIKLLPFWATLLAAGSFAFGAFSGYILKKENIVEKVIEKPVEVIKEVIKKVEVPVEKIVYRDAAAVEAEPQVAQESAEAIAEDAPVESKPKLKRKSRNRKVAE